jgi:peptidoglycan LD-endopeptidase CwlK
MASRDIASLLPTTQALAHQFLANCARHNVEILVYCTLRDCWEQARLYRESHSSVDVEAKALQYHTDGFGFLAEILVQVGPQPTGAWKTNAGPGESWHQYGEAFDAVPILNGRCLWDTTNHTDIWREVRMAGIEAGLTWGGDWPQQDNLHWQTRLSGNPLRMWTPDQVQRRLQLVGSLERRDEE